MWAFLAERVMGLEPTTTSLASHLGNALKTAIFTLFYGDFGVTSKLNKHLVSEAKTSRK
jgi:hypothetical protein